MNYYYKSDLQLNSPKDCVGKTVKCVQSADEFLFIVFEDDTFLKADAKNGYHDCDATLEFDSSIEYYEALNLGLIDKYEHQQWVDWQEEQRKKNKEENDRKVYAALKKRFDPGLFENDGWESK